MGLFDFGKNKKMKMSAPVAGTFQALENVNDEVFAQKAMGEGFGVQPNGTKVYSPIEGSVVSVFKTKHAIGLKTKKGAEILIHMGLDTVELDGEPFEVLVHEGDEVTPDVQLAEMDVQKIVDAGKDPVVLTLLTNTTDVTDDFAVEVADGASVNQGDLIAEVKLK